MVRVKVEILVSVSLLPVDSSIEGEVRLSLYEDIKKSNLVIGLFFASEFDDILYGGC